MAPKKKNVAYMIHRAKRIKLSIEISTCYIIAWIDAVLMVIDSIVIYRKNETILNS